MSTVSCQTAANAIHVGMYAFSLKLSSSFSPDFVLLLKVRTNSLVLEVTLVGNAAKTATSESS